LRICSTRSANQSSAASIARSNHVGVVGTSLPSLAPRWASAWARSSRATDVSRSDTVVSWAFIPLFHFVRKASASGPSHATDWTDVVIDSSLVTKRAAVRSNVVASRSTSTSSAPSCAMPSRYEPPRRAGRGTTPRTPDTVTADG
jgi:hypothetical protein